VRAWIDFTGEVLTERAYARELALCDQAAQGSEAAGVLRGKHARRRPRRGDSTAATGAANASAASAVPVSVVSLMKVSFPVP
jgi:hypothetical protein